MKTEHMAPQLSVLIEEVHAQLRVPLHELSKRTGERFGLYSDCASSIQKPDQESREPHFHVRHCQLNVYSSNAATESTRGSAMGTACHDSPSSREV